MPTEILGMAEAGRRLGLTTRQVVQLVYDNQIEYVIVDGVPRIAEPAVEAYRRGRQQAS